MALRSIDLMIGDWVGYLPTWENEDGTIQRDGNPNNPIICKVEMLGDSSAQLNNGEDDFDADDIELYPIPLTPEILEKNGFTRSTQGIYRIKIKQGVQVRCTDEFLTIIIFIQKAEKWRYYFFPHAYFVHELQHALRLCGIDKEIEL